MLSLSQAGPGWPQFPHGTKAWPMLSNSPAAPLDMRPSPLLLQASMGPADGLQEGQARPHCPLR